MERASILQTYQELKREPNRENYIRLRIASLLSGVLTNDDDVREEAQQFCLHAVSQYPIANINKESREYYVETIKDVAFYSELYDYVKNNWSAIINALFLACVKESDFEEVKDLFSYYDLTLDDYLSNPDNETILADQLSDLANNRTEEWVNDEQSSVVSDYDWTGLKQKVINKRSELFAQYSLDDDWYDETNYFDDDNLDALIETNRARQKEQAKNTPENKQRFAATSDEHLVKEIEILFNGEFDLEFVRQKAEELYLPF